MIQNILPPPTDWDQVADTMSNRLLPQASKIEIFPNVALTVDYHATFGELLIATLLMLLISLIVCIFLYNLILKKAG